MPPWITNDELKQRVAAMLNRSSVTELESFWDVHVSDGNDDAVVDIMKILLGKGFTSSQVDAWDNRVTYNRDIALYHAFTKRGINSDIPQDKIDKMDRRQELLDAAGLMIAGEIVSPGAASYAGVDSGQIDESGFRVNDDTTF